MSEENQALNNEDENTEEVIEESVEIVLEGEEQPSSQVPYGLQKRFHKLTEKVQTADAGKTEAERRLEIANAEIELLKMGKSDKRPEVDDFESDAEFKAAEEDWLNERIEVAAEKSAAALIRQNHESSVAQNHDERLKGQITKHYERAEALKMPNYEELEDKAIEALGNDFAKQIMANSTQSEFILGHLGANPAKAEALKQLAITNPLKAYTDALELGGKLSRKSNIKPAPDPETEVNGGMVSASTSKWAKGATFQ